MLSGPKALGSITEALRDIRAQEQTVLGRLARTSEKIARLRETEAGHFVSLAETRLDQGADEGLRGRLSRAEAKARAMIKQHQKATKATRAEAQRLEDDLEALAEERGLKIEDLEEAETLLEAVAKKVMVSLKNDTGFVAQRKELERLEDMADAAMEKTEQAETAREEKGRPYRDDPLFSYLWDRGYGTKTYRANNLVRMGDNWVAGLCRYLAARPNFAMLNEIPLRLREHAERLAGDAEGAAEGLEETEILAVDKAGGKSHRTAILAAQAEIDRIDAQIVEAEDAREEALRAQRQYAEGSDPAFKDAVNLLAQSLAEEDVSVLMAEARRTETGKDDGIVARIEGVRRQVEGEELEAGEDRDRIKVLAQRRRELEDIAYEFKKSRFDDPRSSFGQDDLVGDLLSEFLRGAISAGTYWGYWRSSQSWRGGAGLPGGRVGLPRSGTGPSPWGGRKRSRSRSRPSRARSSGSGSGFSRPRSGTRGRRRSKGFKTGGGF
ncbi:MAG: hypothetical protein GXP01_03375 [Alphaproteobacteria bacterium]|nr:hypothetical protein [Alphaproteobacteria bacterium]